MKLLLTGAGSPLGRRVFLGLQHDHEVIVLARPDEDLRGIQPELVVRADLLTPDRWGPQVSGVQAAVHLAEVCQASEGQVLDLNLKGTQSLLHGLSAYGSPELLICLSSALIDQLYPDEPDVDPKRFGSAWLAWRCAAEARLHHWTRRTQVPTVVVRSGHRFGAVGIDGPLTGWLEAAAASAEGSGRLELDAADTPLPFVHVDEVARAIVARVGGEPMPGEQHLVGSLYRTEAVGMVASLAQVHRRLCARTERSPRLSPRTSLGRRLRSLIEQDQALPSSPRYLRRSSLTGPNQAWRATFGARSVDEIVEALVGGAC